MTMTDTNTMDYIMGLAGYDKIQRYANDWNYIVGRFGIDSKRALNEQTLFLSMVDEFMSIHSGNVTEDDVMHCLGWNMPV